MRPESVDATFRVFGKSPELWLPASGDLLGQAAHEQTPQGVRVPLRLPPAGSLFVVFRRPDDRPHLVSLAPGLSAATVANGQVRVTAFENGSYQLGTSRDRTVEVEID